MAPPGFPAPPGPGASAADAGRGGTNLCSRTSSSKSSTWLPPVSLHTALVVPGYTGHSCGRAETCQERCFFSRPSARGEKMLVIGKVFGGRNEYGKTDR